MWLTEIRRQQNARRFSSNNIGILDGALDSKTVEINRNAMQSSIALLRDALKEVTAGGGKKATANHIGVSYLFLYTYDYGSS
jgi:hypothetical protein